MLDFSKKPLLNIKIKLNSFFFLDFKKKKIVFLPISKYL